MVDDGSVDKSPDICKAVQQRNPNKARYVRQANGGPATARNNGIELSRGKYVAFVDADDKVSPDFITRMTEIAEETDAQMVICAYWLINGSEKKCVHYDFPEGVYAGNDCRKIAMSVLTEKSGGIPPYSWVRLTQRSVFIKSGLRFQTGKTQKSLFWFLFAFYLVISAMVRWELAHVRTGMIIYYAPLCLKNGSPHRIAELTQNRE